MRVIAGDLGGRHFEATKSSKTHAMSEKVRGSLFNILGDISDKTVLDAFGGTGAISFEAASRGAKRVVCLEKDRTAATIIRHANDDLGLEDVVKVTQANCRSWSENNPGDKFDYVICDPPYHDLQLSTVFRLAKHLHDNSVMVLSHPGRGGQVPTANGVVVVDNRNYGDAALSFYRLGSTSE